MSDTDSFINEVSEEVRREKLFGYLRKYAWVGVAGVLLLVGGAAYNEYRNAKANAAAQSMGDALLNATEQEDIDARVDALSTITADGSSATITAFLQAQAQQDAGDIAGAIATLNALAINQDAPELYRDLGALKSAMLPSDDTATRVQVLESLSQAGAPFRLLALEQTAFILLETGDTDAAVSVIRQIEEDAGLSFGMRQRVQALLEALGEPILGPQISFN